jgi:hypothetical protein
VRAAPQWKLTFADRSPAETSSRPGVGQPLITLALWPASAQIFTGERQPVKADEHAPILHRGVDRE